MDTKKRNNQPWRPNLERLKKLGEEIKRLSEEEKGMVKHERRSTKEYSA